MRLSRHPKMINISPYLTDLKQYFQTNEQFIAVFLFGSYGTKYQHQLNDLDFGVLTKEQLTFDEDWEMLSNFSRLLHENDVNIVFLNKSAILIQHRVLETGCLLFCRDRIFLADFIEYVGKRYCDFRIDREMFNRDFDRGLREEFNSK